MAKRTMKVLNKMCQTLVEDVAPDRIYGDPNAGECEQGGGVLPLRQRDNGSGKSVGAGSCLRVGIPRPKRSPATGTVRSCGDGGQEHTGPSSSLSGRT